MEMINNTYLKFIDFNELSLWDVKRLFLSSVKSKYKIVSLKEVIKERSKKVNLYDFHDEKFWILWVNNKEWIFDAYEEIWKNINQAYKKVYLWDLAYNPYRVNVWSVWIKTEKHKFDYISPAYVVFSCDKTQLLPEYFYILFKSDLFNWLVNENTTWSVRQNLKFSTLAEIKIPLPSLEEQNRIVEEYNKKLQDSLNAEIKARELEKEIESYLMEELGIEVKEKEEKNNFLSFIDYKEVDRWAVESLWRTSNIDNRFKWKYNLEKFWDLIVSYQYWSSEKASTKKEWYPMLRMNNILNSDLILDDLKYVKFDINNYNKFKLNYNDLLFNRTNSKELVWKTALFKEKEDYVFAWYLIRVVIDSNKAFPEYINYLFNSSVLQYQKNLISRQITWQANINAQEMQDFKFPLPPLEIQEKIVKHIWDLKEEIKNLKKLSEDLKESAKKEFEREIFS